ncbi:MAG: SRPBCC domain-containing protein [Bryobacteraceae bacterium]
MRLGEGYSVPVCEIDLRPGGVWRFVNRHPNGKAAFHGEYREIEPPGRLVFTEIFAHFLNTMTVVTAEFTEENVATIDWKTSWQNCSSPKRLRVHRLKRLQPAWHRLHSL